MLMFMLGQYDILVYGQVRSLCQLTPRSTMQLSTHFLLDLSFQFCFRKYDYAQIV